MLPRISRFDPLALNFVFAVADLLSGGIIVKVTLKIVKSKSELLTIPCRNLIIYGSFVLQLANKGLYTC